MFTKDNVVFIIVFLFGLLLPDNNLSYVLIGVFPIALFISLKDRSNFKVDKNLLVFFLIVTMSFIITAYTDYGLENKQVLRYFSFSVLILLFPFSPKIAIPNWVLYFALIFIVLSQLAFSFGLSQIVILIDTFYPYQGDKLGYNTDYLLSGAGDIDFIVNRRYGGIYRNPNQAVRYVTLLFIIFLIESEKLNLLKKIPFILIVFISIILSGSRTGLLVVLFILFYSVFIFNKRNISFGKIFNGIFILVGLGALFAFLGEFNLRIFEITKGGESSLLAKFSFFENYFDQLYSPIRFLFGNFSSEHSLEIYGLSQLDSEWAELFYSYGLLGSITLFFFYGKLFLLGDSRLRFFMLILLWGITSTILFSFKMGFLFMLVLGKYYSEAKELNFQPYKEDSYKKNS
jgi:hypothetical protein